MHKNKCNSSHIRLENRVKKSRYCEHLTECVRVRTQEYFFVFVLFSSGDAEILKQSLVKRQKKGWVQRKMAFNLWTECHREQWRGFKKEKKEKKKAVTQVTHSQMWINTKYMRIYIFFLLVSFSHRTHCFSQTCLAGPIHLDLTDSV